MILATIFDSACSDEQKLKPSPGLTDAMEIMQYLVDRGNTFSKKRLAELQKLWAHLSRHLEINEPQSTTASAGQLAATDPMRMEYPANQNLGNGKEPGGSDNTVPPARGFGSHDGSSGGDESGQQNHNPAELDDSAIVADLWNDISHLYFPPRAYDGDPVTDLSMDEYYSYCYSLQNDPWWTLTGQDVGDFAELGRQIVDMSS